MRPPGPLDAQRAEAQHAVHPGELGGVLLHGESSANPQRNDFAAARLEWKRDPQLTHPPTVRHSEVEVEEATVRSQDVGLERDITAYDRNGQDQRRCVGRNPWAAESDVAGGPDSREQLGKPDIREVLAPTAQIELGARGKSQKRKTAGSAEGAHAPALANKGNNLGSGRDRAVPRQRSRVQRRNQPRGREILPDHEVQGDSVGRLIGVSVFQRSAVDERKEPETDARDEEGHRHCGMPRAAGERQRREPHRHCSPAGAALEET